MGAPQRRSPMNYTEPLLRSDNTVHVVNALSLMGVDIMDTAGLQQHTSQIHGDRESAREGMRPAPRDLAEVGGDLR